eukprot:1726570-Prorocentrum_lima.AAC.1
MVPIHTPPGELVLSASSGGHAGVGDRVRPSTPVLRTPPTLWERTSTISPIRRRESEVGTGAGSSGAQ